MTQAYYCLSLTIKLTISIILYFAMRLIPCYLRSQFPGDYMASS